MRDRDPALLVLLLARDVLALVSGAVPVAEEQVEEHGLGDQEPDADDPADHQDQSVDRGREAGRLDHLDHCVLLQNEDEHHGDERRDASNADDEGARREVVGFVCLAHRAAPQLAGLSVAM
jgi:hypothetical protein